MLQGNLSQNPFIYHVPPVLLVLQFLTLVVRADVSVCATSPYDFTGPPLQPHLGSFPLHFTSRYFSFLGVPLIRHGAIFIKLPSSTCAGLSHSPGLTLLSCLPSERKWGCGAAWRYLAAWWCTPTSHGTLFSCIRAPGTYDCSCFIAAVKHLASWGQRWYIAVFRA